MAGDPCCGHSCDIRVVMRIGRCHIFVPSNVPVGYRATVTPSRFDSEDHALRRSVEPSCGGASEILADGLDTLYSRASTLIEVCTFVELHVTQCLYPGPIQSGSTALRIIYEGIFPQGRIPCKTPMTASLRVRLARWPFGECH
jgi:hypothetical protein